LNERLLAQIAAQTNGKYIYLNDVDKAVEVTREMLNGVEDIIIEDQAFMSYTNYFQWLIALGVILLIIEFVFPERKFEK
jgi:Ca-activated chloride channel family protein